MLQYQLVLILKAVVLQNGMGLACKIIAEDVINQLVSDITAALSILGYDFG